MMQIVRCFMYSAEKEGELARSEIAGWTMLEITWQTKNQEPENKIKHLEAIKIKLDDQRRRANETNASVQIKVQQHDELDATLHPYTKFDFADRLSLNKAKKTPSTPQAHPQSSGSSHRVQSPMMKETSRAITSYVFWSIALII